MVTNGIGNENIIISKKSKNDIGSQNKVFETCVVKVKELSQLITNHNYSLINWNGGQRDETNFKSAAGFTVDIDKNMTIDEAQQRLNEHSFNYIIIPSKRHTAEAHRFHILLFFSHPVYSEETYKEIANAIRDNIFPETDPRTLDAARYIFGSPDNFKAISYFTGNNLNTLAYDHLWTSSTEISTVKEGIVTAHETDGHTPCYCPFHEDSNPSAFIDYADESENYFIHCSSCDHTFWMQKDNIVFDGVMEHLYSYKRDVIQMGIVNSEFYTNPIGIPAFHALTSTDVDRKTKQKVYSKLVRTKHIPHISRIDYIGDIEAIENYYEVDFSNGIITVHYSPIECDQKDNKFIEVYLEERFGEYKEFIKEYLAVYSHTNYQKLPTLVLKGPRGNGKSTFAELIGSIYEPLATDWTGIVGDFSYEVEKKFLIVEENTTSNEGQYTILKKYMGQTHSIVKKKFKDPYKVLNNMAIVLLSNKDIPMYVDKSELPTTEYNNQFFVWEFPELGENLDNQMLDKLKARLGHYIKTKLKAVFSNLEMSSNNRYTISVPITEYEKALFDDNTPDIELDAQELVEELLDYKEANDHSNNFYPILNKGWLPSEFVKTRFNRNYKEVIKQLKKQCFLEGKADRKWNGFVKLSSYQMTKKFIDLFNESQKELEELKD